MSVLIKGMRMPENCGMCPLMTGTFCDILNKDVDPFYEGAEKRYNNCPLVDLGKHGDLIDRGKLLRDIEKYHVSDGKFQHWIEVQQAVIGAEDGT